MRQDRFQAPLANPSVNQPTNPTLEADACRRWMVMQMRSGAAFLGAPPERLFSRCGEWAASEAVAGTRPRDPAANNQRDDDLAFEMLLNPKEHEEFTIVRHSVQSALGDVCADPVLLEMEKAVLKQATVQHLYSQMSGRLKPGCTEAALMAALHPTPAVCGQPQVRRWLNFDHARTTPRLWQIMERIVAQRKRWLRSVMFAG